MLMRFFYQCGLALAVFALLGFLGERLAPASVAPFVSLPWIALAAVALLLLSSSKNP